MSATVQLPGAAPVSVGTGSANALQLLGYTVNGCEIESTKIIEEVPGDQGGGEGGTPIEFQHLGRYDIVRLELSKIDMTVFNKIEAAVNANGTLSSVVAGTAPTPGSLIIGNSAYFRLLINPANGVMIRNYPIAIPRDAHSMGPVGTKWLRAKISFYCVLDYTQTPPLLWNVTTS